MMNRPFLVTLLTLMMLGLGGTAFAQDDDKKPEEGEDKDAKDDKGSGKMGKKADDDKAEEESEDDEESDDDKAEGDKPDDGSSGKMAKPKEGDKPSDKMADPGSGKMVDPNAQKDEPVEPEEKPDSEPVTAEIPDEDFEPMPELEPEVLESITPATAYPYMEHHGYFRFRADAFNNLDLNTTGTSPILPPASAFNPEQRPANPDAEWFAGANIRFRYTPTLHIYEDLSIHLQMDLPDNLVLGSTPDGLNPEGNRRADVPLLAFSGGQQPPDGRFQLRLKQAFGQVRTFFGVIRAGRMASQWGLGILANGGQCIDCDYGDFADRVMLLTKVFGAYVVLGYDFPGTGPIYYDERNPFGQGRDADEFDDVQQWVLAVFKRPLSQEDKDEENRRLKEQGLAVLNGGFYIVYREQEASYEDAEFGTVYPSPDAYPSLVARNASAWIPDAWVQFLWEPKYRSRLRLEMEAVLISGEIGQVKEPGGDVSDCFEANEDTEECSSLSRDVLQFGLAFESEYRLNQFFTFGFNYGYATGRKAFGFQLNEGKVEPELNPSNFKFDRDYHVDMILFREIIGAVTNAQYFNPWVQFDFWTRNQDTFGFRFSPIYARAVEEEATPSGDPNLGIELDTLLFYKEEGKFQADLGYGMLIPLDAFDEKEGRPRLTYPGFDEPTFSPEDTRSAELAHTIQARMFWLF